MSGAAAMIGAAMPSAPATRTVVLVVRRELGLAAGRSTRAGRRCRDWALVLDALRFLGAGALNLNLQLRRLGTSVCGARFEPVVCFEHCRVKRAQHVLLNRHNVLQ